jgi:hypothetical protein
MLHTKYCTIIHGKIQSGGKRNEERKKDRKIVERKKEKRER